MTISRQQKVKVEAVASALGIKICYKNKFNERLPAYWNPTTPKTIYIINKKWCDVYVYLHEMGHVLASEACCNEHDEYMAHGAALALAKLFDIKISKKAKHSINSYAGTTPRTMCPGVVINKHLRKINGWKSYES